MRAPDEMGGFEHFNTWSYEQIVPEVRLEFISQFADRQGNAIDPASVGIPPGIPKEVPHVLTFASRPDGGTDFTVTEYGYTSPDVVELSRAGMDQCLDKLAALLAGESQGELNTKRIAGLTGFDDGTPSLKETGLNRIPSVIDRA